jgi:hypothetical protein
MPNLASESLTKFSVSRPRRSSRLLRRLPARGYIALQNLLKNRLSTRRSKFRRPQLFVRIPIYRNEVIAAMKSKWMMIALLGLGMTGAPVFAADIPAQTPAQPAQPGTVNYVEGAVSLNGQPLNSKDVGNATLAPGQELTTANGKAEILLTPGVFLRVDNNSEVKLVNPSITLTQVELEKGRAGVEVDEIHDQNDLQVIDAGVTTRLDKNGYYEFDANHPEAMVFKGMAKSEVADGKWREIKGHHELALTSDPDGKPLAKEKPQDFDTRSPDDLYNWSSLRSEYLAEANNQLAGEYGDAGYGPGWYWDPWAFDYTFIGGGPFASPFGWGYYPFGWGGMYGGWGYPWYGGWGYGGYYRDHDGDGRFSRYGGGFPHGHVGGVRAFHGGTYGGGFHGQGGFHGGGMGGFHGGMGGFHGGMGGGFHGGGMAGRGR